MKQNSQNFSQEDIQRLANDPAAKQLIKLLHQNPEKLHAQLLSSSVLLLYGPVHMPCRIPLGGGVTLIVEFFTFAKA